MCRGLAWYCWSMPRTVSRWPRSCQPATAVIFTGLDSASAGMAGRVGRKVRRGMVDKFTLTNGRSILKSVRHPIFNYLWAASVAAPVAFCQTPPSAPVAEESRAILDRALKDKNPDTRKEAVVALSLAGTGEPFASWLEAMLDDKDVEVRLATVASLVDLRSKRSQEALRQALKDEVPEVSFAAAKALWALDDPAGKEALRAVLGREMKTKSGFITKQKRDAMRLMHTPKPMFVVMLKSGAGFAPVPGLGAGIASMMGLLTDPTLSGRAAAALLLGKDKDPDTIEALRDALSDKEWSVRAAAVHSLALRNEPAMQPDLEPLLDDKKEAVRLRAAAGYARLETVKLKSAAKKRAATRK